MSLLLTNTGGKKKKKIENVNPNKMWCQAAIVLKKGGWCNGPPRVTSPCKGGASPPQCSSRAQHPFPGLPLLGWPLQNMGARACSSQALVPTGCPQLRGRAERCLRGFLVSEMEVWKPQLPSCSVRTPPGLGLQVPNSLPPRCLLPCCNFKFS